jgi:DNA-binding MarR family transcriptional regulator/N-acetylglutamate synthase-like GNAT family acetyltransferase
MEQNIAALRAFTRFYTREIGALGERLLDGPFSLPEARLVYEIGSNDALTAAHLSQMLSLDPGYLSRLLQGLVRKGVVGRERSSLDRRSHVLALTPEGRQAFQVIDSQSREANGALLERLTREERAQLLRAMRHIRILLGDKKQEERACVLRPHRPGDIGWVISRHGALYAEEYGWDISFEALVADIAAQFLKTFDASHECCWIAERDGTNLGCAFVVRQSDEIAKLRLVLVEPAARGLGLGRRLVRECIRFARSAGYRGMTLWTNDILHAARRIYQDEGFVLVAEERHHSFGQDLVGQNWDLAL